MAKLGRPKGNPDWAEDWKIQLCERIAEGRSVRKVCSDKDMPSMRHVIQEANECEDFGKQYAQAMAERAEYHFEEMFEIADSAKPEEVGAARLQVDVRKWALSKMMPKKFGDKIAVGGDSEMDPIQTEEVSGVDKVAAYLASIAERS